MNELIYKQEAIEAMCLACGHDCDKSKFVYNAPQDEQVIMCPEHYALSTLLSASTDLSNNSPKLDNENGDLISRQDAIRDIRSMDVCVMYDDTCSTEDAVEKAIVATKRNAIFGLERMPSAEPESIRINLNEPIKVKLTDLGKKIYYHQYDEINQIA